jgi:hypothetical protein
MIASFIPQAEVDLSQSSRRELDRQTACIWGARAIVAWHYYRTTGNFAWYIDAIEYRHEAIEHAGSAGSSTLEELLSDLQVVKKESF